MSATVVLPGGERYALRGGTGYPAPAGPARLHWTWKLTTVVWAGGFLFLLLYEWGGTVYRMVTVKP